MKITHDAAVAVVDSGRLLFSWELEKLGNATRHARMARLGQITEVLSANGIDPGSVDVWSIDGWGDDEQQTKVRLTSSGETVEVAGYRPANEDDALARPGVSAHLDLPGHDRVPYDSYAHAVGHAMSAYAASPFAVRRQDALVLVWDGGMPPILYHYDPAMGRLRQTATVGPWFGNLYPDFISHFEPFTKRRSFETLIPYQLSLPGTAMAYAALGRADPETHEIITRLLEGDGYGRDAGDDLARRYLAAPSGADDADVIATFQVVVGELLARRLRRLVAHAGVMRLCLSGGCALNIGWNSEIRAISGAETWAPPFPNDSGNAIGAAAAVVAARGSHPAIDWDVYAGPPLGAAGPAAGWAGTACSPEELGRRLAADGGPVVVLHGRAELGPRALGNRSILAAPWAGMTERLNDIKGRESYRPVAPLCLEHRAPEVFDPGLPDPYMLFVHRVRDAWVERVPAVRHVDGTARLQTVTAAQNPVAARILEAFEAATAVPVLCNTSANDKGRGFFPDAQSAMIWGGVDAVWADGTLYTRAR